MHESATSLKLLFLALLVPSSAWAQDADNDGVPNATDRFPCDANLAAEAFYPAENALAVLAVEDHYPSAFDFDFNDVVIAYNYTFGLDAQGRVRSLRMVLVPRALGGTFSNGLGLQLPVAVGALASATRQVGSGATESVTPRGDAMLTLDLLPNLRRLYGNRAGQINSLPGSAQSGEQVVINLQFSAPISVALSAAPFDLFVFRADNPRLEIHRPAYAGTSSMDATLFGTGIDGSSAGRWFVNRQGIPFALDLPEVAPYPREEADIAALFPRIVDFAASGGESFRNFYQIEINSSYAFGEAPAVVFPSLPSIAVDVSCVPTTVPPPVYSGGACPEMAFGTNSLTSNGRPRNVEVRHPWVPQEPNPPLIIALHWAGGTGQNVADWTGLSQLQTFGAVIFSGDGDLAPFGWRHGQTPVGNEDLIFVDDMIACAHERFNIDLDRVYLWGFSSGGLMATYLTMHLGHRFAAATSMSGGLYCGVAGGTATYWTYHSPTTQVPSLLIWGGANDIYAPTNLNFDTANRIFSANMQADGQFVVECVHSLGHNFPDEAWTYPSFTIDFLLAHRRGQPSPFAGGLTSSFPSWCEIP